MNKQLTIGKPYIKEVGNMTRLEAVITGSDFKQVFYFEVEKEYKKYLCYERGDAFLIGLMYFALVNGYDIKSDAPLSEKLYYQLTDTYIPTVVKSDPKLFNIISIEAELDSNPIKNEGAVGASVSGGVDSFYTIIKNLNSKKTPSYNVTHLVLTNCFNIYYDEQDTKRRFNDICLLGEKIADELGLPFVKIYTNEHLFWFPYFVNLYCFRYCALPYALQKLFAVYDYSSSYRFNEFTFTTENKDSAHYDAFTVHCISSENLTIYSSGGESSRAEKAMFIADNEVVQNNLQVCNIQRDNCSSCEKCMRTMFNFYACNKLEKFNKVFNLNNFEKNKNRVLEGMLERRSYFDNEILELMNKNEIPIPKMVLCKGFVKHKIYLLKQFLKKIEPLYILVRNIKSNGDSPLDKSERYNIDHEYAKKCDNNIV